MNLLLNCTIFKIGTVGCVRTYRSREKLTNLEFWLLDGQAKQG